MKDAPDIARLAALIGEPARANMLLALMRGGARTVSELSVEAGVGLATASAHVAQLLDGGLLVARKSGRHKYLELASAEVAGLVEQMMALSGAMARPARRQPGPRDAALRQARVCYDHLAGARGVQMFQSLAARGHLVQGPQGLALSAGGLAFVRAFGLPDAGLRPDQPHARPPLCRECLDWSERKSHLAGRLGRAFLGAILDRGWVARVDGSRVLRFTSRGAAAFDLAFPPIYADPTLDVGRDSP